ncbi:MAG: VTT domain-containing protein [Nocardioidaceae bacterium]|nr:VTT domain-containing protein [Nocardioidaceae bacterium]
MVAATGAIPLPFWVIAAGLFTAAVLGDQVGHLIGRRIGPRVFARNNSRFFGASHATRAQEFFAKHGPKAVVLARFVPAVRTFTPLVAGSPRCHAGSSRRRTPSVGSYGRRVPRGRLLPRRGPIIAAHIERFAIAMVALPLIPAGAVVRHRLQRTRLTGVRERAENLGTPAATVAR